MLLQAAAGGARSEAERLLHEILRSAGITGGRPTTASAATASTSASPGRKLALEVDGFAFHSGVDEFQIDRDAPERHRPAGVAGAALHLAGPDRVPAAGRRGHSGRDFGALIDPSARRSAPDSRRRCVQNSHLCLDRRQIHLYSQVIVMALTGRWTAVTAQLTQTEIEPVARQEAASVADGADRADGAVRDAAAGVGVQPMGLARRGAGAVLDRPDPALHPAAGAGPAVRAGRPEPARRGDGAAGERQVLPLLHLHLHPVPVRQRDLRRVPVHRVRPELAGLRRRPRLAGQDRPRAVGRRARRGRHQHRTRDGPQEGRTGALAGARSRWRRPATATSTSSTTAATTSASPPRRIPRRPASARRSGSSCRAACGAA